MKPIRNWILIKIKIAGKITIPVGAPTPSARKYIQIEMPDTIPNERNNSPIISIREAAEKLRTK